MATDGAKAAGRAEELDEIVLAYLEAVEAGQSPDRADWLARCPHLARELSAFFADQDQFSDLVAPIAVNTPPPARSNHGAVPIDTTPPLGPGSEVGEYEVIEEIASGGMGVVYKARHRTLNRVVALKMIRAGGLALPEDVARFRLEAESAALLDHPNIVPIYDVGQHDEQPYFSMKLIDGGSLADRPPLSRTALAALMVKVGRAVHYAHERGILHRDLKPANILLDRRGQPHVTDFGLAKRLPAPGCGTKSPSGQLTQTGIAVGTPGYMAPEQANGPKNRVTVAADVYSLGAVLYELLTGRPPFKAETPLETLVQLLENSPPSPRSLVPSVPRDLETICLKSLERDPAQRYASADALADDLQRYLDGEPIRARPASHLERFRRWCRRYPAVASLTALLLFTATASLVAVTILWQRAERHLKEAEDQGRRAEVALIELKEEHRRAEDALVDAEKAKQHANDEEVRAKVAAAQADESFRQAQEIVDRICMRLSEQRLSAIPGLQPLRKELLEMGLKYYQDFVAKRGNDPALKAELAKAHFRVAAITSLVGKKSDAVAAYDRALKTYDELLAADPENDHLREQIAMTCINMGGTLEAVNDKKTALATYERARDLLEALNQANPNQANILSHLGVLYNNLGNVNRGLNRYDESRQAYDKALKAQQARIDLDPFSPTPQRELAVIYVNYAILFSTLGNKDEALKWHIKARDLQEKLLNDNPRDRELQHDLALTYRRIGERQVRDAHIKDGLASLEKGHQLIEKLAVTNKSVLELQWELALSYRALGNAYRAQKDRNKAIDAYRKGAERLGEAHRLDSSAAVYTRDLASIYFELGLLQAGDASTAEQALRDYAEAAALFQQLAGSGTDAGALADLAGTCNNMGILWRDRHHVTNALTAFNECRKARAAVVLLRPNDPRCANDLATVWFNVGQMESWRKQFAAAIRAYETSRDIREQLVKNHPRDVGFHSDLGMTLINLGGMYGQTDRAEEALSTLRHAADEKRFAFDKAPDNSDYRRGLNIAYGALAEVERQKGQPSASAAALLERRKLWPHDPQELYRIARELAQTAAAVEPGKAAAERQRYLDEALATLQQAVAAGFKDAERLNQEADFAPLRNRDDFAKLLPGGKK